MITPQTKICLFGGSFDPIHLGHTFIAAKAVREFGFDKVLFIPCQQSPHKTTPTQFSVSQRLEMCKLATQNLPWAEVSDFEINAPTPSYSWLTAKHFAEKHPNSKLFWLMGTDQWNALPRWEKPKEFASYVTIVVFSRQKPPSTIDDYECIPLSNTQHPASSTLVRQQLSNHNHSQWLHPQISQYLKEKC